MKWWLIGTVIFTWVLWRVGLPLEVVGVGAVGGAMVFGVWKLARNIIGGVR